MTNTTEKTFFRLGLAVQSVNEKVKDFKRYGNIYYS